MIQQAFRHFAALRYVCVVILVEGCALQSGLTAGVLSPPPSGRWDGTWSGHIAALTSPLPGRDGWLFGTEINGTAAAHEGTRWTTGLLLGYSYTPNSSSGAVGFEGHLDFGTECSPHGWFMDYNGYLGGTGAITVWLGPSHSNADMNQEQWVLKPIPELVFFSRVRGYRMPYCGEDENDSCGRFSAELGAAIRIALLSELF